MQTSMPQRLRRLPELAYNLFWTWNPEARRLFTRLDPDLWERVEHNPVRMLSETRRLEEAARDADFVDAYHQVLGDFDDYLYGRETWMGYAYPSLRGRRRHDSPLVAYFSAEFGLHESLPIYSGGLGVLAGDHVKSASDLGLPLVGVGLLYAQGFFRQRIDETGWQREVYEPFHPDLRPVQPALDPNGGEVLVTVELPGRELYLKVWRVEVGRTDVLLLDADLPENAEEDRRITARLYGGDNRTRIAQEMILGVGGVRALRACGLRPAVYHMNEGHAAFLGLERIRELAGAGASFKEARESVARSTVFTTHTPVPAGHDAFAPELFGEFASGWAARLGTDEEGLWALGRKTEEWGEVFNMTALAMRLSAGRNAVSGIHRDVSTRMWSYLFEEGEDGSPDPLPGDAGRPITHVTNGVHTWSWLSAHMAGLYDDYSGGRAWRNAAEDPGAWTFAYEVPSGELWEAHRTAKLEMVENVNARLKGRAGRDGLVARELDPEALTIGFARRFATYKRATLLLSDLARIQRIATDVGRPVQFVFSGKAHPADSPGKEYIQALHEAAEGSLAGSLFVLEDYDMDLTRRLVQGVDLWLNNPRRPLEASGTSGQKASLNGAPNFSVLDGWWPEAYNGHNGWVIGDGAAYPTNEEQDAADAESMYRTLENEILPTFYDRGDDGIPEAWVAVMREAIATVAPRFSTQRMVRDYIHQLYVPRTRQHS